jgi:condensin complex subunit 3
MTTVDSVASILERTQKMVALHSNFIKDLRKLQRKNYNKFKKDFIYHLNKLLVVSKRDLHIERLIQFLIKFAVFHDPEDTEQERDFISFFLQYLIGLCDVKDKTVRFRCCQLISDFLSSSSSLDHITLEYVSHTQITVSNAYHSQE